MGTSWGGDEERLVGVAGSRRAYRRALLDWLACAYAGARESAAVAVAEAAGDGLPGRVRAAATAGHVLDYDDTYVPGMVHLSAPTAPVAVVLGAAVDATVEEALLAYARGFEAMAAVARASHPDLYDRGWHSTAVCGVVGAAVTAAHLLDLSEDRTTQAVRLSLLRAGGLRAAFGSDGKSVQVGMSAASGVVAARLAEKGATVSSAVREQFEQAYGATWADPDPDEPAVDQNWLKAYPCCLQTHSAIEAALEASEQGAGPEGGGCISVHPVSRQAASLDDVTTGLEAKFSLPYLVAFGILRGAPGLGDFSDVDDEARELARSVAVETDRSVGTSEARLEWDGPGGTIATAVEAALGSPARPMSEEQLGEKVAELAGDALNGVLDDPQASAKALLEALGLA